MDTALTHPPVLGGSRSASPFKESGPSSGSGGGARKPNPRPVVRSYANVARGPLDLLLPVALDSSMEELGLRVLNTGSFTHPTDNPAHLDSHRQPGHPGSDLWLGHRTDSWDLTTCRLLSLLRVERSQGHYGTRCGLAANRHHLARPRSTRESSRPWQGQQGQPPPSPQLQRTNQPRPPPPQPEGCQTSCGASLPAWGRRTLFNRLNAACRRHAITMAARMGGHLPNCQQKQRRIQGVEAPQITAGGAINTATMLSLAIALNIREDILAEQFATGSRQQWRYSQQQLPPAGPRLPQPIEALCQALIMAHDSTLPCHGQHRSAPGLDGVTYQMLRNLDDNARRRLLGAMNAIARPSVIYHQLLPPGLSLTSCACKLMRLVLGRLSWIAGALGFLPEQQTGFRRHRCTADYVVIPWRTPEAGEVALLVLLDVQRGGPFEYSGRSTTAPGMMTGVPQGSVLSPLLFNLVLAALPSHSGRQHAPHTVLNLCRRHATYQPSDVPSNTPWTRWPPSSEASGYRCPPQRLGLDGPPESSCQGSVQKLILNGPHPMEPPLTWIPAVKAAVTKAAQVQSMVSKLLLRGRGCPRKLALQLYHGTATAVIQYALPLVQLSWRRKEQLEKQHRGAIRAGCHAGKAQTSPISLLKLRQALLHVGCTVHQTETLLRRLKDRLTSRMGSIWALYQELVPQPPTPVQPPPPHRQPPDINLRLGKLTKRRTPASQLRRPHLIACVTDVESESSESEDDSDVPEDDVPGVQPEIAALFVSDSEDDFDGFD
ncbi:hypothetical protein HPB52_012239 [Rhipicephalus sanguineus]|uniref:Reverse transcriptase domain-containing protein n=1 Tax=Rhipicephalus sanguineus TaxID=34632 RepID=A0A9D4PZV9_RHISA|nr:hypothetical protein HPB52_012239 [Rhipicephalus sanguineus]